MRPTLAEGIADAFTRALRSAGEIPNVSLMPRNRAEARKHMKGQGPYMRFRYRIVKNMDGTTTRIARRVRD
jgi:hypothetical protein